MNSLIERTAKYVEEKFRSEGSGHDWWHIYRVWQLSKRIGQAEHADMEIIELGALLHDIADFKFHGGDLNVGPRVAREWLESQGAGRRTQDAVAHIVENVSFKGANVANTMATLEGKCVQDADRLDALGAIGIARVFAYGGHKGRAIFEPGEQRTHHDTVEAYVSNTASGITHFYEKLLLLKGKMNTPTGHRLAEHRHAYMEAYLEEFYKEWDGRV
jgi:uncharacterized protein